jgi:hypothetical protein
MLMNCGGNRSQTAFDDEIDVGGDFANASSSHFSGKTSCLNKPAGIAAECASCQPRKALPLSFSRPDPDGFTFSPTGCAL